MEYFYNTLGILVAVLLVIVLFSLWRLVLLLVITYLDCIQEESRKAKEWIKKFPNTTWNIIGTSQPPNNKMITLHLRSQDKDEYLETYVSIDKNKY